MSTITVGSKTYTLITLPSSPAAPQSVVWNLDDIVGINVSPFTNQQQVYDWQSSRLTATVTMPPMTNLQSRAWAAFMAACRGKLAVFQFGDFKNQTPQGTGGTATVTASNQTGYTLVTTFSSGAVLPGDWITIGYRLYMVTSTSGGTLGIWPNLRESPASGTTISTSNCTGIFRLAKNSRKFSQATVEYQFSFDIEEAL
jgi:hypothetical protein